MITEDYVSFETAKLLKEKGFDETCRTFYKSWNNEINLCDCNSSHCFEYCNNSMLENYNDKDELNIAAPTLQMAMKWLRTKNIFITVFHYNSNMAPFVWLIFAYNVLIPQRAETYEEAAEASINYVLKHWDEVNAVLDDYYKYDKMLPKIW